MFAGLVHVRTSPSLRLTGTHQVMLKSTTKYLDIAVAMIVVTKTSKNESRSRRAPLAISALGCRVLVDIFGLVVPILRQSSFVLPSCFNPTFVSYRYSHSNFIFVSSYLNHLALSLAHHMHAWKLTSGMFGG
jgi:hypothetical protein